MKLMIINGPSLNLLGVREPDIYGHLTYDDLCEYIKKVSLEEGIEAELYQSNHEGDLVDAIQRAYFEKYDGIIINPAAYTHTSIALRDALLSVNIPFAEVHLSDVDGREDFRKISYISDISAVRITGLGFEGYKKAITELKNIIINNK